MSTRTEARPASGRASAVPAAAPPGRKNLFDMEQTALRELVELVEKLIGMPLALFLSLSGLRSSRRQWHQDFYLKPGYEMRLSIEGLG